MSSPSQRILEVLRSQASAENRAGMERLGSGVDTALGIPLTSLRTMARRIGKDHDLATQLWSSGIHEARLLAALVDDPSAVTTGQMERWVRDFNSCDLVDVCCGNLFDKTPWAYEKAVEWSGRGEEFVKRAGFVLMATLAVHDKKAPDARFTPLFTIIKRECVDDRNFVKKAVNWALRKIGKRSVLLNQIAVKTAMEIKEIDSRAARWVASDSLRELRSDKVQTRLRARSRRLSDGDGGPSTTAP